MIGSSNTDEPHGTSKDGGHGSIMSASPERTLPFHSDSPYSHAYYYYYQNPTTGTVSPHPIPFATLCRLLVAGTLPAQTQVLPQYPLSSSASTELIESDATENYPDGEDCQNRLERSWQRADEVPVLEQCCHLWYYCYGDDSKKGDSTDQGTHGGTVQGPIDGRVLAKLFYTGEITLQTRLYGGPASTMEWKSLQQLPALQVALEALWVPSPVGDQSHQMSSSILTRPTTASETAAATETTTSSSSSIPFQTGRSIPIANTGEHSKHDSEREAAINQELEIFLSSCNPARENIRSRQMAPSRNGQNNHHDEYNDDDNNDDDAASYQSDQGTRYVRDPRTGSWIHEALAPQPLPNESTDTATTAKRNTRKADGDIHGTRGGREPKQKKPKFSTKNAKCWIYTTGLPADATESEVIEQFTKAGILDLDPETQRPKVKLYHEKDVSSPQFGRFKGDASLCYARPESVELAITLLDEAPFRPHQPHQHIRVQRAKFEKHGEEYHANLHRVSLAKRKVAKLAALQARDWDDGEINGRLTGGRKGLRIIVMKGLFSPTLFRKENIDEDTFFSDLEHKLRVELERCGPVEKITVFSKNTAGVVIVKFMLPGGASEAIKAWEGREWIPGRKVETCYWDGVTDYTTHDEVAESEETTRRQEEFGDWLENQELPEEFQLQKDE